MPFFDRGRLRRQNLFGSRVGRESQRIIWHSTCLNEHAEVDRIGQYYISFYENADRPRSHDALGTPMLNYGRHIGKAYDPLIVGQWGLKNHDLFKRTGSLENRQNFIAASDWICDYLDQDTFAETKSERGSVFQSLWHAGSAHGQGISLLVRAHSQTGEQRYREAADRAFAGFLASANGGDRPASNDSDGNVSINGSVDLISTRSLSGFIWSAWGIYDYFLANGENLARDLFARSATTLASNLEHYDLGFWSLYQRSGTLVPWVASCFYHELHINQMRVMFQMTGAEVFANTAERWRKYATSRLNRTRALGYRVAFECCYPS
jgi:heparosan-N-sulfate-glucuronate 5-epimerase